MALAYNTTVRTARMQAVVDAIDGGSVERATRTPIHQIHDDEMLAMLAMVLVLTDD